MSSSIVLASRPTPERNILKKDSRGKWRVQKDAYVEQLRRLGNPGSSRPPLHGTMVTISKRLPLQTSFMGTMNVSPEELAVHHSFARGDGTRAVILQRQVAEMRTLMAGVVGNPHIRNEEEFFDWIDKLVESDERDHANTD